MIRDEMPEARIVVTPSAAGATEVLQTRKVDISFVNLAPGELAQTDLVKRMEAAGVTVVLLGAAPQFLARSYRILETPFVQTAVAKELRAVMRRMRRQGWPEGT